MDNLSIAILIGLATGLVTTIIGGCFLLYYSAEIKAFLDKYLPWRFWDQREKTIKEIEEKYQTAYSIYSEGKKNSNWLIVYCSIHITGFLFSVILGMISITLGILVDIFVYKVLLLLLAIFASFSSFKYIYGLSAMNQYYHNQWTEEIKKAWEEVARKKKEKAEKKKDEKPFP